MAGNHITLSKSRFLNLLIAINTTNADRSIINEALLSVKNFKEFNDTFQSFILKAITPLSPVQVNDLQQNLRNDLGFSQHNVSGWTSALNTVLDLYGIILVRVVDHEFTQLNSVADLFRMMRNKVKPESLYASAMIKIWVKDQRRDNLTQEWFDIREGQIITTNLGISDTQLKSLPQELTKIAKEFKADTKITIGDLKTDDIGKKTVKACADYILQKAKITFS